MISTRSFLEAAEEEITDHLNGDEEMDDERLEAWTLFSLVVIARQLTVISTRVGPDE